MKNSGTITLLLVSAQLLLQCSTAAGSDPLQHSYLAAIPNNGICAVTGRPAKPFVPPSPYLVRPPDPVSFWFGTTALWTQVWAPPPWTPWNEQQLIRMYWASTKESGQDHPPLVVKIKRLDAEDVEHVFEGSESISYTPQHFGMRAAVIFPSVGCWEVTGQYLGTSLSYVVQIEPAEKNADVTKPTDGGTAANPSSNEQMPNSRQTLPNSRREEGKRGTVVLNGHDCTAGDPYCKVTQEKSKNGAEQQRERSFRPVRELLLKQVPFDPDILLEPSGIATLRPVLDRMPEMKQVRRVDRLDGLVMADTLYITSNVTIAAGTVVVIVNHLVSENCQQRFESQSNVRGKDNFYFYLLGPDRILGMSLDAALKKNNLSRDQFDGKNHLPPFSVIRSLDLPKVNCSHAVIDTSGRGAGQSLWPW